MLVSECTWCVVQAQHIIVWGPIFLRFPDLVGAGLYTQAGGGAAAGEAAAAFDAGQGAPCTGEHFNDVILLPGQPSSAGCLPAAIMSSCLLHSDWFISVFRHLPARRAATLAGSPSWCVQDRFPFCRLMTTLRCAISHVQNFTPSQRPLKQYIGLPMFYNVGTAEVWAVWHSAVIAADIWHAGL